MLIGSNAPCKMTTTVFSGMPAFSMPAYPAYSLINQLWGTWSAAGRPFGAP